MLVFGSLLGKVRRQNPEGTSTTYFQTNLFLVPFLEDFISDKAFNIVKSVILGL